MQILRGTGRGTESGSPNILSTNNLLVCTLGTGIRLMTIITGSTHQYILKQYGQQNFWSDRKFYWYLEASTVNANLDYGHFQKRSEPTPTLQFIRVLSQELLKNDYVEEDGGGGRPQRPCNTLITFPCELVTAAHYCGMWDSSQNI